MIQLTETMVEKHSAQTPDDSRTATDDRNRRFTRGSAAVTALAAGVAASAATSATAAAEDDELGVLPGSDYYPGGSFDVLAQLATEGRNDFLDHYDPDEDEFDEPDDWQIYSIQIETDDAGIRLGHLLVDTDDSEIDPEPGDSGSMDETASFRNAEYNLIETQIDV